MPAPLPPSRPLFLDLEPHRVLAQIHEPANRASGPGVLICPPWGWDDVASYRSRRAWAEELARAGYPTVRFDYPGTGESEGGPGDPHLVEAWIGAVTGVATWVRELPGVNRIAVIGLGLGGLLAGASLGRGAPIDDLALWAAPARGRSFIRAEKAFSRLQSSRYTLGGDPEPDLLPDGWMETGGFVLSAETIAALGALSLLEAALGDLRRALLLGQDGIEPDPALRARLEEAGVDVSSGSGNGWGAMFSHPETSRPALEVFGQVRQWLGEAGEGSAPARRPVTPEASESAVIRSGSATIRESSLRISQPFGHLAASLTEPAERDSSRGPLCAVFLNAGAVRRTGPNRLWLEAARRWAARGVPAVRVDLEGIGDADGDAQRYSDVGEFYVPRLTDQTCAVLEELEQRGLGSRFIVIGLCSGGYWAFHAAARGAAIDTAVLLNPQVLFWDPKIEAEREARKVGRLLDPAWIREVLRGGVGFARIRAVASSVARRLFVSLRDRLGRASQSEAADPAPAVRIEQTLDDLRSSETRLLLAFSGDEPLRAELERDGFFAQAGRWPRVEFEELPARDHTVRPIVAQRAVHELLDRELERALASELPSGVGIPD